MCGICALVKKTEFNEEDNLHLMDMGSAIKSRGPDATEIFRSLNFGFLHNRLSIIGDSDKAAQPMHSKNNRYTIIFNGEIYNYKNLAYQYKLDVEGSDTRLLIELIDRVGIKTAVNIIEGMYAFIVFDSEEKCFYFITDRYGQKPIYYSFYRNFFSLSSELSSFRNKNFKIDRQSLDSFIRFGHVPLPHSMYKGVKRAKPGHLYKINKNLEIASNPVLETRASVDNMSASFLSNVIKNHLESDVPVCTFLSSGVDSAIVTSLASQHKDLTAFTFDFNNKIKSEVMHAQEIANYLNINHEVVRLDSTNIEEILWNSHNIFSEPLADPAALALTTMCIKAREYGFKVGLTGDGGDEIFGGYTNIESYYSKLYERKLKTKIPKILKKYSAPSKFGREYKRWLSTYDNEIKSSLELQHIHQYGDYFGYASSIEKDEFYKMNKEIFNTKNYTRYNREFLLAGRFCPKVDRASSSVGFELRAPFLADILSGTKATRLQKIEIYKALIPQRLHNLKKIGFAVDIKSMILTSGKDWLLENIESYSNLLDDKFKIRAKKELKLLKLGIADISFLYRVSMLISWLRNNK